MPRISTEGRAVRHHPAERGTVHVRIRVKDERPEPARALAQRALDELAGIAQSRVTDGSATWWGAEPVVTWSASEWYKPSPNLDGTTVVRHHAGATVKVKFRDFSKLHELVDAVPKFPGAAVTRIDWALTEKLSAVIVEAARAEAAKDAHARAEAYARALGFSSVAIVHLYEEGLRPGLGHAQSESGLAARNGVATSGETGDVALRPEEIEVTAVVTADFDAV